MLNNTANLSKMCSIIFLALVHVEVTLERVFEAIKVSPQVEKPEAVAKASPKRRRKLKRRHSQGCSVEDVKHCDWIRGNDIVTIQQ